MPWLLLAMSVLVAPAGTVRGQGMEHVGMAGHEAATPPRVPSVELQVDSAHHRVLITLGPFDVPAMHMDAMSSMAMEDGTAREAMHHDEPVIVYPFAWPIDAYGTGFRLSIEDSAGRSLPRSLLHHIITVNYDRRQLVFSGAERLFGAGTETEDVSLPWPYGVPLAAGQRLGAYVAWHNETGHDLRGARIRLTIPYVVRRSGAERVAVYPIYLDPYYHTAGDDFFDLPPGASSRAFDFVVPVSGHLLGVGGHLHQYGRTLTFEDGDTGHEVFRLRARQNADGTIRSIGRKIFWLRAPHLVQGHRYRVVASYTNPERDTVKGGGMASILGLFMPDDPGCWPAIDPGEPEFQQDVASLPIAVGVDAQGRPRPARVRYADVTTASDEQVVIPAPQGAEPGRGIVPTRVSRACAATYLDERRGGQ